MVFWQSPRTRKQARPDVRVPTARAAGIDELEIIVDAHERYPYRFTTQQVRTVRRGLVCGDYAVTVDERLVAVLSGCPRASGAAGGPGCPGALPSAGMTQRRRLVNQVDGNVSFHPSPSTSASFRP